MNAAEKNINRAIAVLRWLIFSGLLASIVLGHFWLTSDSWQWRSVWVLALGLTVNLTGRMVAKLIEIVAAKVAIDISAEIVEIAMKRKRS